jgi:2-keto-4-pentenoate hydratase/2-oxohepta-3-ene-1,7-dioic acid hydratase in catechol pathway
LKSPGAVIGPGQPILLPGDSAEVHFEGEIALVLGRRLRRVAPGAALDAVLGVTAACDVTARDLQRADRTFTRAKSFDTFCPLGPVVQLRPRWDQLAVTTRLNGEMRQQGDVRQMLWGFAELLSFASRFLTFEPGDVVLTGTPAGVGALADGDQLEVEVSSVGVLRSPVRALAP